MRTSEKVVASKSHGLVPRHVGNKDPGQTQEDGARRQMVQLFPRMIPFKSNFHSCPHTDSLLLQASIEFLGLSITVVQCLFTALTCLLYKKRDRLKARVVIYAY
jgi:hypothetical protein